MLQSLLRSPLVTSHLKTILPAQTRSIIIARPPLPQPITTALQALLIIPTPAPKKVSKFDETISLTMNLRLDPRKPGQNIRGSIPLPFSTGRPPRILILSNDEALCKSSLEAGAKFAGFERYVSEIKGGESNILSEIDRILTTPSEMSKLASIARILGPRGLMPNPKTGGVTTDILAGIAKALKGEVLVRTDKNGVVSCAVGKVSQGSEKVQANIKAVVEGINEMRIAGLSQGGGGDKGKGKGGGKGQFFVGVYLSTTQGKGRGVKVDPFTVDPSSVKFFRGGVDTASVVAAEGVVEEEGIKA